MGELTTEGFKATTANAYAALILEELTDQLTAQGVEGIPDPGSDILISALVDVFSLRYALLDQVLLEVLTSRDPDGAEGAQLSSLGLIVGVQRQEPTASTVPTSLLGTAGTIVPAGRKIRGGGVDGDAVWTLRDDTTLDGTGTGTGTFESVELGAIPALVATIWDIIEPVPGWVQVKNTIAATEGDAREEDGAFRVRRQQSVQASGAASARAIRAVLLELQFLQAVTVLENDDGLPATIEGVDLAPHSAAVIIYPSPLSDEQITEVAKRIYDNLATGIQTSGAETTTVTGLDLSEKEIRYSFPATVTVNTAVQVEMEPPTPTNPNPPTFAEVEENIENIVLDYSTGLDPGEDARQLPLQALINEVDGVRYIEVNYNVPSDPSKVQSTGDVLILAGEIADLIPNIGELT